ncbi:MAG: hypothetical protein SF028_14680 [Candidatus Sumerlaeia bacterium]|nr:hypothetical protein [Candidatus Sumerlaeia bacterium]
MSRAAALLLLLAAFAAAGCGRKREPSPLAETTSLRVDNPIGDFKRPVVVEDGVGIRALANPDGSVTVSVENQREEPLVVSHRFFALVTGPERGRDLVALSRGTADLALFPDETLPPLGRGVYAFRLNDRKALPGMRLVYRDPLAGRMFFVDLE